MGYRGYQLIHHGLAERVSVPEYLENVTVLVEGSGVTPGVTQLEPCLGLSWGGMGLVMGCFGS